MYYFLRDFIARVTTYPDRYAKAPGRRVHPKAVMMALRKNRVPLSGIHNGLLVAAGLGGAILLAVRFMTIHSFGGAVLYGTTWVIFLHLCVGVYVLGRHLRAQSQIQKKLDFLAFLFLLGLILSFSSPALWCAFSGAMVALSVAKYLVYEEEGSDAMLRQYAREKARWEAPMAVGLVVFSIVLANLPESHLISRLLQMSILLGATAFAVWMIAIKQVYRQVADRSREIETAPSCAQDESVPKKRE